MVRADAFTPQFGKPNSLLSPKSATSKLTRRVAKSLHPIRRKFRLGPNHRATVNSLFGLVLVLCVCSSLRGDEPSSSLLTVTAQAELLDNHCVVCHDEDQRAADLAIDQFDVSDLSTAAEIWEKVVLKIRTGEMPPADADPLSESDRDALASSLETALDLAAAAAPNPGRPAVHRLNRTEYAAAVRDLLGLEIDSRELLPADDAGFGFDNIADTLSFSPVLMERYIAAAETISRLAVGDLSMRPSIQTIKTPKVLLQNERMSEELPFGSRGGLSIRHRFPLDGQYILRIELAGLRARGPEPVEVRLDGTRIKIFGSTDKKSDLYGGRAAAKIGFRFQAEAGTHTVGISFLRRTYATEGLGPSRLPPGNIAAPTFAARRVSGIEFDGPHDATGLGDTESRRRIFVCRPDHTGEESACAEQILSTLARRAFRRPVSDADVSELLAFYESGRERGSFDMGIQAAIERLLVDPEFLFRVERDPPDVKPGSAYAINDIELASRLSFFLWSSIPDNELLKVAERGELGDPDKLESQVRRMLADERSIALVENFAAQWLYLRNMRSVTPDLNLYPEFDDNLRDSFRCESELFIADQIRHDRSLADLLSADYSFVNERLARHYGIPNVYGSRYRKIQFADGRRGGLLGQGSILTVTSYATRTSPVLRGKWLLENILGSAPPPPPDDVPALSDSRGSDVPTTMRERMSQHSTDPACASCHQLMDPLGFALENFDAVGQWRTEDETGAPIDASGSLPDGSKLGGPADLRKVLLDRREQFSRTIVTKLLTYALGRGLDYHDAPAIRQIMRDAAADDFRWHSVILGISRSQPFQMRRAYP